LASAAALNVSDPRSRWPAPKPACDRSCWLRAPPASRLRPLPDAAR